jgi:membrane protein YdbS with pleckstrin-like domain
MVREKAAQGKMRPLRVTIPLEPSKIIKKTISNVLLLLFLMLCFIGPLFLPLMFAIRELSASFWMISAILTIIFLVLFLLVIPFLCYIYQKAYYKIYFYDASEDFLIIKKGVFTPRETTLPFEKINDVYIDQDLLDRGFKLFDVHFSTATEQSGLNAHIDGLNQENATKMRDLVLASIKKSVKRR